MEEFYRKKFDLDEDDSEIGNVGSDSEKELKELEDELNKLKKHEKTLLQISFNKDKKAKKLQNTLRELTNSSFSDFNHKNVKDLYKNHGLTEEAVKSLRSIEPQQKNDATFVRKLLHYLYEGEISKLNNKSRIGAKPRLSKTTNLPITAEKSKMTPEKLSKINQLFKERVDFCANSFMDSLKRKKRINLLVSESLKYIKKKNNEA